MKIADAEAYICHFPLTDPFYPSWIPGLPLQNNSCIMLRLVTDEGIEGACAGMAFTQEWKGVPDLIKLFLIGRDPFQVEDFIKVLRGAKVIGFRPHGVRAAAREIPAPTDDELLEILRTSKRIAVVGLSRKPHRASYGVAEYLQSHTIHAPASARGDGTGSAANAYPT